MVNVENPYQIDLGNNLVVTSYLDKPVYRMRNWIKCNFAQNSDGDYELNEILESYSLDNLDFFNESFSISIEQPSSSYYADYHFFCKNLYNNNDKVNAYWWFIYDKDDPRGAYVFIPPAMNDFDTNGSYSDYDHLDYENIYQLCENIKTKSEITLCFDRYMYDLPIIDSFTKDEQLECLNIVDLSIVTSDNSAYLKNSSKYYTHPDPLPVELENYLENYCSFKMNDYIRLLVYSTGTSSLLKRGSASIDSGLVLLNEDGTWDFNETAVWKDYGPDHNCLYTYWVAGSNFLTFKKDFTNFNTVRVTYPLKNPLGPNCYLYYGSDLSTLVAKDTRIYNRSDKVVSDNTNYAYTEFDISSISGVQYFMTYLTHSGSAFGMMDYWPVKIEFIA